ncbi:MAG: LysR family transcriptional regulator [Psychromonas sp.]
MATPIDKLDKRDIRRLELFCEIVEQGGISNATISTGLSQPVLSSQLIELEKSLGVTLCLRGRSGFELTHHGHTVYNYANELQNMLTDFAFKLKGVRSKLTGHVRVGCLDNTVTLEDNLIPKAIEAFYQLSDNVELTLVIGDFTQINEKLSKNQLDMMIVVLAEHQEHSFTHVTPLFEEESFLYARSDLANDIKAKQYSLENQRINIGGYSAETMYKLLEVDKISSIQLNDGWHVESGIMLALSGTHLSFLPTHLIDNYQYQSQLVPLKPEKWHFTSQFSVVLKSHKRGLSPAASAFYDCLVNVPKNGED